MNQQNPTIPPPPPPPSSGTGGQLQCPNCGSYNLEKVSFTWWGGIVGPRIYNMHKCKDCKTEFNGKTGEPITGKTIAIYSIIAVVIVIVLCGGCSLIMAIMENAS